MQVNQQQESGFTVLQLEGEVDMQASPEARKVILDCLENGSHLCVDLSGVSYMDSSGIASLVEGLQRARAKKLIFGLLAPSQSVMQVLRLSRLDSVFNIYDTKDQFRQALPG